MGQVQTVSSLLIIYRVVSGRSLPSDAGIPHGQAHSDLVRLSHIPSLRFPVCEDQAGKDDVQATQKGFSDDGGSV